MELKDVGVLSKHKIIMADFNLTITAISISTAMEISIIIEETSVKTGDINDIRINEEANRNSFPNRGNYFPNQGMFIAWGAHQGNYQQLQNFPQQSPTMVQPIHNQQLLHPLGVQSAQQHPPNGFGQHTP